MLPPQVYVTHSYLGLSIGKKKGRGAPASQADDLIRNYGEDAMSLLPSGKRTPKRPAGVGTFVPAAVSSMGIIAGCYP
jgi:hypothetical protein